MSKFGRDDDDKPKPQNGQQPQSASLNGFRLDSSQSSWLMDRLNALNEEDKIAMSAHAQQMADQDYDPEAMQDPAYQPQDVTAERNNEGGVSGGVEIYAQNADRSGELAAGHAAPGEQPQGYHQEPQNSAPLPPEQNDPQVGNGQEGDYQMSNADDPTENARLLRERIESLERQIAEISKLTGEQKPEAVEQELIYRGVELKKLKQKHREETGQSGMYRGVEVVEADERRGSDVYDLTQEELADADYEYLREQLEPHLDAPQAPVEQSAPYRDYSYQQPHQPQQYRDAGYSQPPVHGGYDQRADPHYPPRQEQPYYQGQRPHGGEDGHAALPQFLNNEQPGKSMRPSLMTILAVLFAAVIAGGVGYSYLGEGVSDVVKGDFSGLNNNKEGAKLSDIAPRRDLEVEAARPAAAPKELKVAANPAQLASQFKVDSLIGVAGEKIDLPVQLPNLGEFPSAFLVLRDMPNWAIVDSGRRVNGAWIINQAEAKKVSVTIPDDQPGTFAFTAELVYRAGQTPITQKVNAVIAPVTKAEVKSAPETVEAKAPVEIEAPEQIKTPEVVGKRGPLIIDEALEEKWLERGTRLLRAGDVAAARLAFSHLAEQGSGRGALAMAMTFDPNQPSSRVVAGIEPDVKRARFWYQRALALGNESARDQLRMLDNADDQ